MTRIEHRFGGVWLPIITPFLDGELDKGSFVSLLQHYRDQAIDGYILGATTGEGMTLNKSELNQLIYLANEVLGEKKTRPPLFLGLSSSHTQSLVKDIQEWNKSPIDGYLVTCPYYVRPSQDGIFEHFEAAASATDRPIMIYNIPYRTGINMTNDCLLRLSEIENIVGLKDCCADASQSAEFNNQRPENFSVLTGEDKQFLDVLSAGADGGITMSAHLQTAQFAEVLRQIKLGNPSNAASRWKALRFLPDLLFAEPSPAPVKYWLWRKELVTSPEVRLPMTPVSATLAQKIDQTIAMGY